MDLTSSKKLPTPNNNAFWKRIKIIAHQTVATKGTIELSQWNRMSHLATPNTLESLHLPGRSTIRSKLKLFPYWRIWGLRSNKLFLTTLWGLRKWRSLTRDAVLQEKRTDSQMNTRVEMRDRCSVDRKRTWGGCSRISKEDRESWACAIDPCLSQFNSFLLFFTFTKFLFYWSSLL